MKKRIFCLFMCVVMCASLLPGFVIAEEQGELIYEGGEALPPQEEGGLTL